MTDNQKYKLSHTLRNHILDELMKNEIPPEEALGILTTLMFDHMLTLHYFVRDNQEFDKLIHHVIKSVKESFK